MKTKRTTIDHWSKRAQAFIRSALQELFNHDNAGLQGEVSRK